MTKKIEIKRAIEATAVAGIVTPDGVVEAARDKHNPLHSEFDWDDASAAHQHRLDRARQLIRSVAYVVIDGGEATVARVHYIHHPERKLEQGYIPLSLAAKNREIARGAMLAEIARCKSALIRAMNVADALGVESDLQEIFDAVEGIEDRINAPPPRGRRSRRKSVGGDEARI